MDHFSASVAANASCDLSLKVILVGESGCGKSSILQRFTRDLFSEQTQSTIAVDFQIKNAVFASKKVAVQVWDTAGQEKYFTITTGYYRQADAVVLVCDLTNAESFARVDKWMEEVRRHARPGTPCVLLGNKSDLGEATRKVSVEAAQQWATAQGMPFFETSARMGSNVDVAFDLVCSAAVANKLRDEAAFHSSTTPSSQVPRSPVDQLGQSSISSSPSSSAAASSPSRNAPSSPVVNLAASQLGEAADGEKKSCAC